MSQLVGVIGAGIMGSGIAQVFATYGFPVVLTDVSKASLDRGLAAIESSLDRQIKSGKLVAERKSQVLGRIQIVTTNDELVKAKYVIEAATENLELKLSVLEEVARLTDPDSIIASNTSSISITRLAAAVSHPERMIGMHFFNPVPLMELVEIVRGVQTSDHTTKRATELAISIGKMPILVKNMPGFALNRILFPMINEAIFALQEGLADAKEIDAAMKLGANHPIGPLALADMVGLDTTLAIMEVLHHGFADPKYRPAPLLREMVDAGLHGRKTGRGFFNYAVAPSKSTR